MITDPRRAGDLLHRAAEVLRWTAAGQARVPWRWADPDPEVGTAERSGRPTSPKHLQAFPARPADPAVPDPVVPDPRGRQRLPATPVAPSLSAPLAGLLDALARQLPAAVTAGGSLDDEPFRSALRLATVIVECAGPADGA